ncbi:ABC transporter permease [Haloferax namakaokahaiae]|uniref:ABC transporter permease n=1 Tax=Haloferax namakaokahaiae TaxID=1748331 RepID=A0ABD5ZFT6_9EURY
MSVAADSRAFVALVSAVARKQYILLKRYPINTVGALLGIYAFFVFIFFGGRTVAGPGFDDSLDSLIVGYFLVTMAFSAYQDLAGAVMREAQWGTLEQLYMAPLGFGRVMAAKTIVNVAFSLLWGGAILALMLVTTGSSISVDVLTVVPLGAFALASVVGVGFAMAGLALLYKRVNSIFGLLQFGFVGLAAAPVEQLPLLKLLPLAQGSYMLQRAMTGGVRLWEFPLSDLAVLVAVGIGYTLVGYLVFDALTTRARKKGVLGHY